jgi:hypothetical protein
MLFVCLLFGHGFSVLRLDMLHSVLDASKGPVVQTFTFRSAFTDPSSTPCASVTLFFVITSSLFLDGAFYAAPTFDRSMKASKSALSNRRRFPKVTDGIFLPQAIVRTNQMVAPKYSAAARTFNSRGVTGAAVTGFFLVAAVIAGLLQGQPGVTPRLLLNRFIGLFFAGVF